MARTKSRPCLELEAQQTVKKTKDTQQMGARKGEEEGKSVLEGRGDDGKRQSAL